MIEYEQLIIIDTNNIVGGCTSPATPLHIVEDTQEVFRVLPEYQTLTSEKKLLTLNNIQSWIDSEFNKLRL